ncbi:hypothetical protein HOC35_05900 [Candidatus Woesearchaeota archaeon]|jgi:predicted Zn-dependent protease|nr:hypothetical protein [Candidatus Woesearchaeota archaeon]
MVKINKIISLLKKRKLDGWKISLAEIKRTNLYYTKYLEKESELNAFRTNVDITIYKHLGKEIGESSFSILDENEIDKKINDALVLCDYSTKPKFSLPVKNKLSRVSLVDKKLINPIKHLEDIHKTIKYELTKNENKNIKPNNLELHSSYLKSRIVNSNGVDFKEEKTALYVELTLTASGVLNSGKEQEHVAMKEVSSLSKFNANKFVQENVSLVKDVLNSSLIKTFKGNVMLSGEASSEFFAPHLGLNPLVMHASAKIKHMNLSKYNLNKKIAKFNGDKLTILSNPLLKLNPSSSLFDGDGVVSKKIKLIDNGVFNNYFSNKQYADYLKIKATGALGSIEVSKGKKLAKAFYVSGLEIVSFSSFSPNSISGDFSAEIRLGYVVKKDKSGKITKKPFKGGMFTGNIFDLIEEMYLSKEIKETNGYKGPKLVMFKNAIVSGME